MQLWHLGCSAHAHAELLVFGFLSLFKPQMKPNVQH